MMLMKMLPGKILPKMLGDIIYLFLPGFAFIFQFAKEDE